MVVQQAEAETAAGVERVLLGAVLGELDGFGLFAVLGEVGGDRLLVEGALDIPMAELEATWERTIPAAMSS